MGSPRPVDGYRAVVEILVDLPMTKGDIRKLIGSNASALLDLAAE
jgi:hypothetical protein